MNMQPLVSVIIPVYNSFKYFEATIKSVISQSYSNLEIILVNDGCTDSTPEIIEKYAALDSRIIVINKANQGTQYARKDGIGMAKGKYIQNLDCDDILLPDAILDRVAVAESTNADIVVSPFYFCPEDRPSYHSATEPFEQMTGIDYLRKICYREGYWASWTYLHRHSLYLEHEIKCDQDIMMTEDTILTTQLMCYASKVVWSPKPVVGFTVRTDSLSNNKTISQKKFNDLRKYPVWIEDFIKSCNLEQMLQEEIAFLKIRVAFESFSKNHFELASDDMKLINSIMKRFPGLKNRLFRREKKIINVFRFSSLLGLLNLYRYAAQKKI